MMELFIERGVWMKNNDLLVPEWNPEITQDQFFKVVRRRVQILNEQRYLKVTGSRNSLAQLQGEPIFIPGGKIIENLGLYVNKDAFIIKNEDFSDLIPTIVRHKIYDFWLNAKNKWSDTHSSENLSLVHNLAFDEQWRYAFELGKGDRLLKFVWKHSRQKNYGYNAKRWEENLSAYHKARNELAR